MSYVLEQSAGDLIRNTFGIYRRHFFALVTMYLAPTFPFLLLTTYFETTQDSLMVAVFQLLQLAAGFFAFGAATVAISDICLANPPSLSRSYGAVGRIIGKYTLTYLLVLSLWAIGTLLLIIPGIYVAVVTLFALPIVILERKGGIEAVKRSRHLAKGHFWRILGILTLMWIFVLLMVMALLALLFGTIALIGGGAESGFIAKLIYGVAVVLPQPLVIIFSILLYYDIRVRKEQYDTAALSQELLT